MKKIFVVATLILITLLGAAIRFYQLGESPKGLYIDEAGQGYSAYSILKTGKDEFAYAYPVVFRSFTDFKTPLYVYLIVPLIPLFDLTTFTVRFPSFLFSVLTFPLLFLIISKLTTESKYKIPLSLLATLLLAISPWHTLFGRTNFECNVALFLFLLGIYLFYISLKKPWVLIFSAIIFTVSLPAYHSERLLTPLTALFLFIRNWKLLTSKSHRYYLIVGVIIAFIITIPTLKVATTPGFLARASGLNIFSHQRQRPSGYIENLNNPAAPLVNSSLYLSTKEFLALYFSYLSPRDMFNLGDYGPRSSFPNLSTFYVWQFPFYILGLYFLIKRKTLVELRILTLFLLIISPIPAAVTRDPYTTIRALPLVIPQIIIISLGILEVIFNAKTKLRLLIYLILTILIIHSILNLYSSAIILNEYHRAKEWDYGVEQISDYIKDKYLKTPIVFDNSRDDLYIALLFFLKYDPQTYQTENFEVSNSEYYTNMNRNLQKKIGKIITKPINWEKDLTIDQYLIGDELAISYQQIAEHQLKLEKDILYPDKSHAFRIVRTNPNYENSQK